jgi:menaquinone-dependent protoporphyrinogen IX oxidase
MRTLVLYTSSTGSTKKYAEDIAMAVHGDVMPLRKFKAKNFKNYDTIVFGGWVMGNTIQGLNKFLASYDLYKDKNVIVFSSGMSFPSNDGRDVIIEQNLLDMYHIRYYQLRGNFDYRKVKFPYNILFSNSIRMIAKDPNATADQKMLLQIKNTPIIYYDQAKIDRIISVIHSLNVVEVKAEDKK